MRLVFVLVALVSWDGATGLDQAVSQLKRVVGLLEQIRAGVERLDQAKLHTSTHLTAVPGEAVLSHKPFILGISFNFRQWSVQGKFDANFITYEIIKSQFYR